MKHKLTYLFALCLAVVLAGCLGDSSSKGRKIPKLTETYSKADTKPFGGNIAYRQLEAMYTTNSITDKKQSFTKTWLNISDTGSLYVCIAPQLFVSEEEVDAMMEFVEAGNSLFIAAGLIDKMLLDKINSKQVYSNPALQKVIDYMDNTSVTTVQSNNKFDFYYYPFENYFSKFDTSNTRVLGYNPGNKPNFIVHFYGKGKLFLHCEPRTFSNYFLLTKNNYNYFKHAVAFTPSEPQHVYWDDHYYKQRRKKADKDFSSFSEIMKHPPLAFALWLTIILLLLYVLFAGKRRQRIVEELKPNENTTVTFTETIGRLYLQKKDNKNIADKMVTYFNEYIRNTYFLNTNQVNNEFIIVLSRKSGVEKEKVETLYRTIAATQTSTVVNDYQLLSLHEQIQQFYKNKGNKN